MKTLIHINTEFPNGCRSSKIITYFGNILFNKSCTNRFWSFRKNAGAIHIFGFRFTISYANTREVEENFNGYFPKPLFSVTLKKK